MTKRPERGCGIHGHQEESPKMLKVQTCNLPQTLHGYYFQDIFLPKTTINTSIFNNKKCLKLRNVQNLSDHDIKIVILL